MNLLPHIPVQPGSDFHPFADAALGDALTRRFEQQVRAGGDRTAIRWADGSHTYASLNATANRLARTLLARCADATEPVALLFAHGGDALAAIIAVLKAGKCYVVLDPGYPPERIGYMLADSGARFIVADAAHADFARELAGGAIGLVAFDEVDPSLSAADLATAPAADDLATILYTSGSTGRPKGVMHSHRTILADARNITNGWRITADDRLLLSTSLSFANSVRTIYGALLNGAGLYPFDVKRQGFGELAAWLTANAITVLRTVPTFLRSFMATLEADQRFPAVRIVSAGGESMLQTDLAAFNRHFSPQCVLSHAFGPTECLTVCWALIPHGTPVGHGKLPIGRALPDKDVLLLDEARREVGVGDVGEIAVRSRYISRGYWRDPERTRAAFLPDPDGGDRRIYLTGDYGRRNADGTLVHVGRRDFQVKIRGYRIDVSEIECALRTLPGIREAVVTGREVEPGEQRLVAYYVAAPGVPVAANRLRAELARLLPDFMLPSAFVALGAMPVTPNGKTDRARLPMPPRASIDAIAPPGSPGSALEVELAAIWAAVLGVEQVGIDAAFMDLGGDSLQAAMIAARVTARYRLEVPVSMLLRSGTVTQMAKAVEAARA